MIINYAVKTTANAVQEKIDMKAYFLDNVPEEDIRDLEFKIKSKFDVASVSYISKQDALDRWQTRSINQRTKDLITQENNPLPRTLEIRSADPKVLNEITQIMQSKTYQGKIYRISYPENQTIIEKMSKIANFVELSGLILGIIFAAVSAIVIFNTIRLTIFSRKEEIEIMELVGASGSFVRLPFIVEALLYGILAVFLTIIITFSGLKLVQSAAILNLDFVWLDIKSQIYSNFWQIILAQIFIGIVISIASSWLSVKKYLK
ncbi:MAG: cell division transport system permease protein [Candidatus Berkelbacteria bacterium Licking1014_7]|uniref:Cell division protein FtsX n=1 Tax=Candidatus Berkelbacteria bacterium Licking1014_7 TaxID=2017147 RepID=A0A554LKD0_9BACT|nr:MAG: cell division transport system permease protein [Candidatus Berkelbacteria bacterium Licking1014_7]